jgi:hypothetical protein
MFNIDWTKVLGSGDPQAIWNAIFSLVQDRHAMLTSKQLCPHSEDPTPQDELTSDIAQEIFLRLISTDRLSYFMANNYTSQQIQHEIVLRELPAVLICRIGKLSLQDSRDKTEVDNISPATGDNLSFLTAFPTKLA